MESYIIFTDKVLTMTEQGNKKKKKYAIFTINLQYIPI